MTKFIRKYQKVFLAVFGVLLMIIFIIPSSMKSGRNFTDHVVGHLGNDAVYLSEEDEAAHQWKIVSSIRQADYQGRPEPVSALFLGAALYNEIDNKPLLFLLLQKEAAQQGVVLDDISIDRFVDQNDQGPDAQDQRQAFRGLLLVAGLRQRLSDTVKNSLPLETHLLAKAAQKARLSVVTFRADQFKDSIPTPTVDQLRKMYDSLSHVLPTPVDTAGDNPFLPQPSLSGDSLGFGYQLPRRVKVQYIEVPRQALLDSVAKGKTDYQWDVAAREYYYSHQADFPATQPTTGPASQPTVQPFVETRHQILDQLRSPDADILAAKIRQALLTRLDHDYAEYVATMPATNPSTPAAPAAPPAAPAALGGKPFATEHYLEQITLDISKNFGILPIVREVTEFESSADLSSEIGIGQAKAPDQTTFADYAIGSDDPAAKGNMSVYEPSAWLSDPSNNDYLFRLTAIAPSGPAPFEQVQTTVATDWVTQQAYNKALAAAKDLAKSAKNKSLPAIAAASGRPAYSTEYFSPQSQGEGQPIPGAVVEPKAQTKVASEAQTLLAIASQQDPRPIGLVEVPALHAVIVVQLIGTQLAFPPGELWKQELNDYSQFDERSGQILAMQYFTYDATVKRLAYVPEPGA